MNKKEQDHKEINEDIDNKIAEAKKKIDELMKYILSSSTNNDKKDNEESK